MSESNGVIKIGEEGFVDFEFKRGEASITVTLDVIKCNDRWVDQDRTFRAEDGRVVKGREEEQRQAMEQFVHAVVNEWLVGLQSAAAAGQITNEQLNESVQKAAFVTQRLSMAQILRFHAEVGKACQRIKPFFSEDTGKEPSSPPPSGTVVYSE